MNTIIKSGLTGIVLAFLCSAFISAQDTGLKDPKTVSIGGFTVKEFMKTYKGVLGKLGIPLSDAESVRDHRGMINFEMDEWGYDMALFRSADFSNLDLTKAAFNYITLSYANLSGSKLEKAKFRFALLQETDFSKASLIGTDFTNANLNTADFTGADLSGTIFKGARMGQAKGLTVEQLLKTKTLSLSKLPDELYEEIKSKNPKLVK